MITTTARSWETARTAAQFFGGNVRGLWFFAARPLERCEQDNGWRTQIQGLAAYVIPKIDVQVSATLQNLPGAGVNANSLTFSSTTALGRPFSQGLEIPGLGFLGSGRFFNIVDANDLYVERLNQLDFRVANRTFGRTARTSTRLLHALNANSVITETRLRRTSPTTWLTPQASSPRALQDHAQFEFCMEAGPQSRTRPLHVGRVVLQTGFSHVCGLVLQTRLLNVGRY